MAKNTAKITVNVINQAQSTSLPPLGIVYVIGETVRGIPDNPEDVITSVAQFERLYGGVVSTNDFPLICEQAIQAGALLRVCRVTGAASDVATSAKAQNGDPDDLFYFTTKGEGTYYNSANGNFSIATLAPTNGDGAGGYFNLLITDVDAGITELYENLLFVKGTAAASTYLKDVVDNSRLVDVVYEDTSGVTSVVVTASSLATTGGADAAPVIANYTGVQASKTGFYAFDDYNDSFIVSAPGVDEVLLSGIYASGKAYAALRKDMVYLQHISNTLTTATAITSELQGHATSKFAGMIGGGVKIADLVNGGLKSMSEMGMVLGAIASSHQQYGPWYSVQSYTRGLLPAAAGVVNNFGSPAAQADRELIANDGGNMVVNKNGTIMIWDMYSMDAGTSPEKFLSVVWLELYMISVLKPLFEFYLGEPNHWNTWERMYYAAKPFLDDLVGKEALYSYQYNGDQFVKSLAALQINDATEVGQGKYVIQLQMKVVVPMVDITLNIILTENSVDFV